MALGKCRVFRPRSPYQHAQRVETVHFITIAHHLCVQPRSQIPHKRSRTRLQPSKPSKGTVTTSSHLRASRSCLRIPSSTTRSSSLPRIRIVGGAYLHLFPSISSTSCAYPSAIVQESFIPACPPSCLLQGNARSRCLRRTEPSIQEFRTG